jgi:hypothetical protein
MLLPFNTTVWFYRKPIDFRKQIDGIVILVADTLQKAPDLCSALQYVARAE